MNTITVMLHNTSITHTDIDWVVKLLCATIIDISNKGYPLEFIMSGDWYRLSECCQDLYIMHAKDQNQGLRILYDLAQSMDFNMIEKEKATDQIVEHLNTTNQRLYGLKNACETIKRVHLEFHQAMGTPYQDIPQLFDTNMPIQTVAEQSNSIIVRH